MLDNNGVKASSVLAPITASGPEISDSEAI